MAANVYSSPERTIAFMQHLDDNLEEIKRLRTIMTQPGYSMADRTLAFTKLFALQAGNHRAQHRLLVDLEYTACRQLDLEKQ